MGPQVVVQYSAEGAEELLQVQKELAKQLQLVEDQLSETAGAAGKTQQAYKTYAVEGQGATKSSIDFKGGALVAAQAAVALAKELVGAVKGLVDFSKAGGEAIRVAKRFKGDIDNLRKSSLNLIDDTSLQSLHSWGTELGLTSEAIANVNKVGAALYAQGFGASALENVKQLMSGSAEAAMALGVGINEAALQVEGMTESQKKLAIVQQVAAHGAQVNLDAIDQSALGLDQAQNSLNNFIGDLQVAAFEFLNSSGVLETLTTALTEVKGWWEENRETVERFATAALAPLNAGFTLLQVAVKLVTPLLKVLAPVVELVAAAAVKAAEAVAFFLGPVGDLLDALTAGIGGSQDFTKAVKDAAAAAKLATPEVKGFGKAVSGVKFNPNDLKTIVDSTTLLRNEISYAGNDAELLGLRLASLGKDPQEAVNLLRTEEAKLTNELQKQAPKVDELETKWKTLQTIYEQLSFLYGESDPRVASLKKQVDAANVAWVKADDALADVKHRLADVKKAGDAVADTFDKKTKAVHRSIDVAGLLKRAWGEAYVAMGGDRDFLWTLDFHFALNRVNDALDKQQRLVSELAGAYEGLSGVFGAVENAFIGDSDAWAPGGEGILPQLRSTFLTPMGSGPTGPHADGIIQQGSLDQTLDLGFTRQAEQMALWREELSTTGDAFSQFVARFENDADNFGASVIRGIDLARTGLVDIGDTVKAIQEAGADSTKAWQAGINGGIKASGTLVAALIKDEKGKAAVMGAMEIGYALSDAAFMNYWGAAAHTAAAIQFFAVAGGGAGKAKGSAKKREPEKRQATLLSRDPNDRREAAGGTTITNHVYLQSWDRRSGAATVADVLNEQARLGSGIGLDSRLIQDARPRGL